MKSKTPENLEEACVEVEQVLRPLFAPMPEGLSNEVSQIVRGHLDLLHKAVSRKVANAAMKTSQAVKEARLAEFKAGIPPRDPDSQE